MKFEVNIPDYHGEDSWREIQAFDAEDAAEKIAEEYYNYDPSDANDLDITVLVRIEDCSEVLRFRVSADYSVNFYAREVS